MQVSLASIRTGGGIVYAIQRGTSGGVIKIGFTSDNVFARIRNLQTGSAEMLVPIGWTEGTQEDERALHALLTDFRMQGEWFFPTKMVRMVAHDLAGAIASTKPGTGVFADIGGAIMTASGFVRVDDLTEMELCAIVKERRENESRDVLPRMMLERAAAALRPIWRAHPDLSFGQVCSLLSRAEAA